MKSTKYVTSCSLFAAVIGCLQSAWLVSASPPRNEDRSQSASLQLQQTYELASKSIQDWRSRFGIHDLPPMMQASLRKKRNAQQIDGNESLASLLKDPKAVKMVLDYLTKQKLEENRRHWREIEQQEAASKRKAVRNQTRKPPKHTTNREVLNKPPRFLIPSNKPAATDARVDKKASGIGSSSKDTKKRPPTLSSLFNLSKLLLSKPSPIRRKEAESTTKVPKWLTPPKDLNNPLLTGEKSPDLQYFGPSDFVPQNRYRLPMKEHGPLKLRYMSAQDFPNVQKYGLIPIPRR